MGGRDHGADAPIPLVPAPGVPTRGEELLVDENEWARGQEFFRLADLYPSPDGRLIAWARDTSGDERYTWVVQEASGRVIDEAVAGAGYGFAWADDSASFIYMGVDDAWRACDVWLHRVGTPREDDELLLVEPDEGFEMGFAPSGFPGHVVIHASSSTRRRCYPQGVRPRPWRASVSRLPPRTAEGPWRIARRALPCRRTSPRPSPPSSPGSRCAAPAPASASPTSRRTHTTWPSPCVRTR